MPGGVSSPARSYKAVGLKPVYIREGSGAWMTDADGNRYIDYVCCYGPLILGHAPPAVVEAIAKTAAKGTHFGTPTELESELASMVIDAVDAVELVRFVNSGTEAVMSAIRLARAATGRDKIIKCEGCYHGHSDALLVEAGSGPLTLGVPSTPGVPASVTEHTLLVPFNDLDAVRRVVAEHQGQVACVLLEPLPGNMGCIPPVEGYLEGLRTLCDEHGVLLVFDEVMSGFRAAYGGAQERYGVDADLVCLGKVIGGGLPCAAYGGSETLMRQVAPDGPVYQAGTFSGYPLAMAAGITTLKALKEPGVYERLDAMGRVLVEGLKHAAEAAGVPVYCTQVGSMVACFMTDRPVLNYRDALGCDADGFSRFFGGMLDQGVIIPPSAYETWFVSTAHDDAVIEQTLKAAGAAFKLV